MQQNIQNKAALIHIFFCFFCQTAECVDLSIRAHLNHFKTAALL